MTKFPPKNHIVIATFKSFTPSPTSNSCRLDNPNIPSYVVITSDIFHELQILPLISLLWMLLFSMCIGYPCALANQVARPTVKTISQELTSTPKSPISLHSRSTIESSEVAMVSVFVELASWITVIFMTTSQQDLIFSMRVEGGDIMIHHSHPRIVFLNPAKCHHTSLSNTSTTGH
jgi:hypothetical protein